MDVAAARALAEEHLAEALPRRWQHSQAVAATAADYAARLGLDPDVVVVAAWLHDVGYAPPLADTGFHPLDGAALLARSGWPDEVVNLVAHHSCADVEAERRGLGDVMRRYPDMPGAERDVLWASDATTGPDGQRLSVAERVLEVVQRYEPADLVSECMVHIAPQLAMAMQRTSQRIAGGPVSPAVSYDEWANVQLLPHILPVLEAWNPEGIAEYAEDEYEPEAQAFSSLLRVGYTIDVSMVVAVWEHWFGPQSCLTREHDLRKLEKLAEALQGPVRVAGAAQPM
ncbi:HD domain-containing protein [Kineococcus xinjiangensis]|uniref:HD domain-containing protein n=1 Tax=Kineococcus xinjiangensis TaxID=512762 RepID=UPI001304A3F1|nr:HD domain-containing protein [Kineococcus xinjiangensis]